MDQRVLCNPNCVTHKAADFFHLMQQRSDKVEEYLRPILIQPTYSHVYPMRGPMDLTPLKPVNRIGSSNTLGRMYYQQTVMDPSYNQDSQGPVQVPVIHTPPPDLPLVSTIAYQSAPLSPSAEPLSPQELFGFSKVGEVQRDVIPIRFKGDIKRPTADRPFMCNHCSYSFKRIQDLKRHFERHYMQFKPYMCDRCGTKFTRSDALARHVRMVQCRKISS
jgi:uncharacterized Zn-finger protein